MATDFKGRPVPLAGPELEQLTKTTCPTVEVFQRVSDGCQRWLKIQTTSLVVSLRSTAGADALGVFEANGVCSKWLARATTWSTLVAYAAPFRLLPW